MAKICACDGCSSSVFGGGYCKIHQWKRGKVKRLKLYSNKRKEQNKILSQQVRKMLIDRPVCEINSPVCTYYATCGHHVAGRIGKNLLDKSKNIPACYPCNLYVEENDAWARDNGFKTSKFTPVNK